MSLQDQNTLLTCKHLLSQESPYQRTYFYVGGQYVDDGKGNGRHVLQGQLYVEQLTPVDGIRRPWPVVLIHGGGQTGTVRAMIIYKNIIKGPLPCLLGGR